MKKNLIDIITVFVLLLGSFIANEAIGQVNVSFKEGKVSYISGESIYIKFESTEGIENGDTLYLKMDEVLIPVLIIIHHSSISCLGNYISDHKLNLSDTVYAKIASVNVLGETKLEIFEQGEKDMSEQVITNSLLKKETPSFKQQINGRISASSYSNFAGSSGGSNSTRMRYTMSLDASNISNSRISVQTYISFAHQLKEWDVVKENIFNALKIYSLAVKYDINKNSSIWLGRKINPRIANVGAIDGLQFQTAVNDVYFGVVVGSRPDYQDYSFNSKLFEYGAYIGHESKLKNGFAQSSIAFFEQRNQSKIDRRFVYLQHSNRLTNNLNFFSSSEIDLYSMVNGVPTNNASLTSIYLSLGYRISEGVSVFGSYDARKNVIYYETFKNYADEIFQQATRQGLRFRLNLRPFKYFNFSMNAGTRFSEADARKTKTLNISATYTQVPIINASVSLNANLMQTNYLDGTIAGIRLSKDFVKGKINTMLQYRYVKFDYVNTVTTLNEHIAEIDFSYQMSKKVFLSVNFESTFQKPNNTNRIYLNIRRKF
ncbi:MAG: hypothetical protein CVU00_12345 [Bacteroidetes bacterium HGW-Bacteroidetes-17]|jgi:hypothetical protein|nr:MAG: hypothetical protein CVU00_12345 [Bacteroidetes bacterium HGW-Bacteroidetes-17]